MTPEEIIEKLRGKEVYGFEFKGVAATDEMKKYIGEIGIIGELHTKHPEYTKVIFRTISKQYYYPTKELEDHLVEEEPIDLNQLFNQIKSL